MSQESNRQITKDDVVGQRIVRILDRDGEYDGYPTNDAGFVLENGIAFSLCSDIDWPLLGFEAEPDFRECVIDEILGKPIRALCYVRGADGYAQSDSVFLDLTDGPCVFHRALAPEGIYVGIYWLPRDQLETEGNRICDYFDEPPERRPQAI